MGNPKGPEGGAASPPDYGSTENLGGKNNFGYVPPERNPEYRRYGDDFRSTYSDIEARRTGGDTAFGRDFDRYQKAKYDASKNDSEFAPGDYLDLASSTIIEHRKMLQYESPQTIHDAATGWGKVARKLQKMADDLHKAGTQLLKGWTSDTAHESFQSVLGASTYSLREWAEIAQDNKETLDTLYWAVKNAQSEMDTLYEEFRTAQGAAVAVTDLVTSKRGSPNYNYTPSDIAALPAGASKYFGGGVYNGGDNILNDVVKKYSDESRKGPMNTLETGFAKAHGTVHSGGQVWRGLANAQAVDPADFMRVFGGGGGGAPNVPTPSVPTPGVPSPGAPSVPRPNVPTPNVPRPTVPNLPSPRELEKLKKDLADKLRERMLDLDKIKDLEKLLRMQAELGLSQMQLAQLMAMLQAARMREQMMQQAAQLQEQQRLAQEQAAQLREQMAAAQRAASEVPNVAAPAVPGIAPPVVPGITPPALNGMPSGPSGSAMSPRITAPGAPGMPGTPGRGAASAAHPGMPNLPGRTMPGGKSPSGPSARPNLPGRMGGMPEAPTAPGGGRAGAPTLGGRTTAQPKTGRGGGPGGPNKPSLPASGVPRSLGGRNAETVRKLIAGKGAVPLAEGARTALPSGSGLGGRSIARGGSPENLERARAAMRRTLQGRTVNETEASRRAAAAARNAPPTKANRDESDAEAFAQIGVIDNYELFDVESAGDGLIARPKESAPVKRAGPALGSG